MSGFIGSGDGACGEAERMLESEDKGGEGSSYCLANSDLGFESGGGSRLITGKVVEYADRHDVVVGRTVDHHTHIAVLLID